MALKYACTNPSCSYPGASQYEIVFRSETILDSNNVAASFCPFCRQEMVPSVSPDAVPPAASDHPDPSHPA